MRRVWKAVHVMGEAVREKGGGGGGGAIQVFPPTHKCGVFPKGPSSLGFTQKRCSVQ